MDGTYPSKLQVWEGAAIGLEMFGLTGLSSAAPVSANAKVREPTPAPTSTTGSPGVISAKRAMRRPYSALRARLPKRKSPSLLRHAHLAQPHSRGGLKRQGRVATNFLAANTRCLKKSLDAFLFESPVKLRISSLVRGKERIPDRRRAFTINYFEDPALVAA